MKLDIDFVRSQFSQLRDEPGFVFASNAGGSYVCKQVNELMERYNRHTRVQPYSRFGSSREAGEAMDRAKRLWAEALNIDQSELTIGPSTSINSYVMAQAIGSNLKPGDEIVVTNQDHEANSGVWRRKAEERGVTIRQWEVDIESGLLDPSELLGLLSDKTRWVFFTHCSNVVGTVNPVAEITKLIKDNSPARVFVDAVAYAPHHICDLQELGVDGYVLSLYKVFGPHQSLLYVNETARDVLTSQAHYFNAGHPDKDFGPAGPQHGQVAACAGVIDYFDLLHLHHFGDSQTGLPGKMSDLRGLVRKHENRLAAPILEFLSANDGVRLIGKAHIDDADRVPTIAFRPLHQSAKSLVHTLQDNGIGTENGHFYAHRLISDLGIDADDGVVRLSLVQYNLETDAFKIVDELERALS